MSTTFRSDGGLDAYSFWSVSRFVNSPTVREARHVSFFSIVVTILTCVIGLVAAIVGDSAATLAYSLARVPLLHRSCTAAAGGAASWRGCEGGVDAAVSVLTRRSGVRPPVESLWP